LDADERELRPLHDLTQRRGKSQAAALQAARNHLFEPRLVEGDLAGAELLYLFWIDVDTRDFVPEVGEARAGHKPDVAGSDDRYAHGSITRDRG
jgi:hypothetical protein